MKIAFAILFLVVDLILLVSISLDIIKAIKEIKDEERDVEKD